MNVAALHYGIAAGVPMKEVMERVAEMAGSEELRKYGLVVTLLLSLAVLVFSFSLLKR